jgi:hypothetical protein
MAFAAVLYTMLGLIYLQPIWRVWQDRIAPNTSDPLFVLWILKWGAHQIRLGLPDAWNANIFHPTRGTLALSDHLLGPAAQLALFETVIPNAIAGYNFLFFTSFVLTGLAVCWVIRRSGASWTAAVLAGAMYAFSPFRIGQLNHLQLLLAQWVPLTLWFWDRLLAERTMRRAGIFLVFYLLNVTGGSYLAYMIHIPMLAMLINRAASHGRGLIEARSLRVLIPTGLIAGVALAAVFLPYVRIGRELGLARDADEIGLYGATSLSWLSPARDALWFGPVAKAFVKRRLGPIAEPFFRTENALFAGFVPTLLAGIGLWVVWRRLCSPAVPLSGGRRAVLAALLVLAAAAWIAGDVVTLSRTRAEGLPQFAVATWIGLFLVACGALAVWAWLRRRWGLGPVLRWRDMEAWERGLALSGIVCFALAHPIAYVPLMHVLPGLDGMRVAARFAIFVSLALVHFAARGLDVLLERLRGRGARFALIGALFVVLALELAPRSVRWARLERQEDFPQVYSWIAQQGDVRALLELPVRPNNSEAIYMYYSTVHWKPLANGFSGYRPRSHELITSRMRFLPDAEGLDLLSDLWITHLVVHSKAFRNKPGMLPRWEREHLGRRVELVHTAGEARVYRLIEPANGQGESPGRSW